MLCFVFLLVYGIRSIKIKKSSTIILNPDVECNTSVYWASSRLYTKAAITQCFYLLTTYWFKDLNFVHSTSLQILYSSLLVLVHFNQVCVLLYCYYWFYLMNYYGYILKTVFLIELQKLSPTFNFQEQRCFFKYAE